MRLLSFLLFVFAPAFIVFRLLRGRFYLDFATGYRLEEMSIKNLAILRVVGLDLVIRAPLIRLDSV